MNIYKKFLIREVLLKFSKFCSYNTIHQHINQNKLTPGVNLLIFALFTILKPKGRICLTRNIYNSTIENVPLTCSKGFGASGDK